MLQHQSTLCTAFELTLGTLACGAISRRAPKPCRRRVLAIACCAGWWIAIEAPALHVLRELALATLILFYVRCRAMLPLQVPAEYPLRPSLVSLAEDKPGAEVEGEAAVKEELCTLANEVSHQTLD